MLSFLFVTGNGIDRTVQWKNIAKREAKGIESDNNTDWFNTASDEQPLMKLLIKAVHKLRYAGIFILFLFAHLLKIEPNFKYPFLRDDKDFIQFDWRGSCVPLYQHYVRFLRDLILCPWVDVLE